MEQGKIIGFQGSWGSGLGYLVLEGGIAIPCDNGATVRALDACFGGVITDTHTVNNDAIRGKEIVYETDWLGLLEWFAPRED